MNIRDMHDVSFQLNLILTDLKLAPLSENKKMSGGLPDDAYGELVLRQILLIQETLTQKPEKLEVQYSPSNLNSIFQRIETITTILSTIHTKKNIDKRISQATISVLEHQAITLHDTTCKIEINFKSLLQNKAKIEGVNTWGGMLVGLFSHYIESPTLSFITPTSIATLDTVIKDNEATLNDAAKKTAHGIAHLAVESLCDQILNVNKRDAILRAPFLKSIFVDPNASNPKPTKLGVLLIDLIQNHPEFLEKLIAANMMKGLASIYTKFNEIQTKKEYFLVDFFDTCLKETLSQFDTTNKTTEKKVFGIDQREKFVSGKFQQNLSEAILKFAFPGGEQDLVLPGWSIIQPLYRENTWSLMNDVLQDQLRETFRSFSENQDLTKVLITNGLEAAHTALSGTTNTPTTPQQIALSPIKGIATIGIVFVFFNVLFSTMGNVISTIFSQTKPTNTPYPYQKDFNFHIRNFLHILQKESNSPLLKLFLKYFGSTLVENIGPTLVEGLKNVKLTELITTQLDQLNFTFTPPPYTLDELKALGTQQELERKELDTKLNTAKKALGGKIEGLIQAVHEQVKLKEPKTPPATASSIEKMVSTIQKFFVNFANKSSLKFISFSFWIFDVQSKIRNVSAITHKRAETIEQDSFLIAVSQFGVEKLAPHVVKKSST